MRADRDQFKTVTDTKQEREVSPSGLAQIQPMGWKPNGRDHRLGSQQSGLALAVTDKFDM